MIQEPTSGREEMNGPFLLISSLLSGVLLCSQNRARRTRSPAFLFRSYRVQRREQRTKMKGVKHACQHTVNQISKRATA